MADRAGPGELDALADRVELLDNADRRRRHMRHPLNGRFGPLDHAALEAVVDALARAVDPSRVDCVLGFPEAGAVPAFAFARAIDRPLILSSQLALAVPGVITFEVPGSQLGTVKHLYGLDPGARALIVEDEITTGRTVVAAVRALRAAGVEADEAVALLAVDHPALWRLMAEERIALHVGLRLPPRLAVRPLDGEPR